MNTKIDPYATKLQKKIDLFLLIFIVALIVLVVRSSARGEPLFNRALPLAQQPFWSSLSIFTWQTNDTRTIASVSQGAYATSDKAAALLALKPAPAATNFSPIILLDDRKPRRAAVAQQEDVGPEPKSFPAPSALSSATQISGFGSALPSAADPSFRTGSATAGANARNDPLPVSKAIDVAPRSAGDSSVITLTPSNPALLSRSTQTTIAGADNTNFGDALRPEPAPTYASSRSISLNGSVTKVTSMPTSRSITIQPDASGQQGWDGGGGNGLWSNNSNWGNDSQPNYGTLFFDNGNNSQTTMTDNNITAMNQLNWSGTSSWTLNQGGSTVLSLSDNGGTQAKIENGSTGTVTINLPITFAASMGNKWGEINAINGNITFASGTLTVNGSGVDGIRMFGGSGSIATTFNNTVSASGKYFSTSAVDQTINIGGAFTSGDFYLMNSATLNLNSGGSFITNALRLGGDLGTTGTQNQALGATFALTNVSGGQSFSSTINAVAGNTSGALLIDSRNTSGTNTISSGVFADSNLKTQTSAGGTLLYQGGSFDIKNRTLTVTGSGNTTINEVLGSSLAAGGSLIKSGSGTLILQGTSNNYTGTGNNSLNVNGTQIAGGTLGIYGDGSLGIAPLNPSSNIQFIGSGTLQDTANNVTLVATRNILIGNGFSAAFDSDGNRFTVNGIVNDISDGGALTKIGAGTLNLPNAANSYTGVTTITNGILEATKLANANSNSSIGNSGQAASNLVINGGTLRYTGTGDSTNRFFTIGANGATLDSSGSGALNLTATGTGSVVSAGAGNRVFTLTGTNTGTNVLSGLIADPTGATASLVKSGAGAWLLGGSASSFTGTTTINGGTLTVDNSNVTTARLAATSNITVDSGGTLLLSLTGQASVNRINNSATLTLNGGTFNTAGLSERQGTISVTAGLGALTLQSSSVIDLANGASILAFSNSSAQSWTGTLSIYNWSGTTPAGNGTDQLYFGINTSGLTATQLGEISFYSGPGTGFLGTGSWALDNDGEVIPLTAVPEPSTWAAGALALLALAYSQRRRFYSLAVIASFPR